jgi:hypothetical protein
MVFRRPGAPFVFLGIAFDVCGFLLGSAERQQAQKVTWRWLERWSDLLNCSGLKGGAPPERLSSRFKRPGQFWAAGSARRACYPALSRL